MKVTKLKNKFGFTLSEVLITLGIIGVVAALTIPIINKAINSLKYDTASTKVYSELAQISMTLTQDNGGTLKYLFTGADDNALCLSAKDAFAPYMKTVQSCSGSYGSPCWYDIATIKTAGTNTASGWKPADGRSFIDASGMYFLFFQFYNSDCTGGGWWPNDACGGIMVDLNGNAPPNRYREDVIVFNLYPSGKIVKIPNP